MLYLIIANVTFLIGYLFYRLVFRKLTFFEWNRYYLLGMLVASLLVPIGLFVDFSAYQSVPAQLPTIDLTNIVDVVVLLPNEERPAVHLTDVLLPMYWLGVVVSVLLLLWRLSWFLRHHPDRSRPYESYSFLGKVFLGRHVAGETTIAAHEMVHVKQGHTYDILFVELVRCFCWFNPVVYFYQKELKLQHEYIADARCADDKVAYAELLLAHALHTERSSLIHEFSNSSYLKKRIMILFKDKSKKQAKLFYLLAIPALMLMTASTLVFNTTKAKSLVQHIEQNMLDVQLPTRNEVAPVEKQQSPIAPQEGMTVMTPIIPADDRDTAKLVRKDTVKNQGQIVPADVLTSVEVQPEPPGGMAAFRNWISRNYTLPQAAIDAGVKGVVELTFVVREDGALSDFVVKRDLGYGTGEAAVALMQKGRKWSPGIQYGKPVNVQYSFPIRVDLRKKEQGARDSLISNDTGARLIRKSDADMAGSTIKQPEPPNGMASFRKWIADNFEYPQSAIDAGVKGVVEVNYTVELDGSLSEFKVIRDLGHGVGEALVALMKKSPSWTPAIKEGKSVRMQYVLPVRLGLSL